MKIILSSGFNEQERLAYKPVIHDNIKDIFISTINATDLFNYTISDEFSDIIDFFQKEKLSVQPFQLTSDLSEILLKLWKDEGIQKTIERRNEYDLLDSTD